MNSSSRVRRQAWLLGGAFIGVFACFGLLLFAHVDGASAVGGAILVAAGTFLKDWSTGFSFEFGSSHSNQLNQEALRTAATTPPAAPNTITIPLPQDKP